MFPPWQRRSANELWFECSGKWAGPSAVREQCKSSKCRTKPLSCTAIATSAASSASVASGSWGGGSSSFEDCRASQSRSASKTSGDGNGASGLPATAFVALLVIQCMWKNSVLKLAELKSLRWRLVSLTVRRGISHNTGQTPKDTKLAIGPKLVKQMSGTCSGMPQPPMNSVKLRRCNGARPRQHC